MFSSKITQETPSFPNQYAFASLDQPTVPTNSFGAIHEGTPEEAQREERDHRASSIFSRICVRCIVAGSAAVLLAVVAKISLFFAEFALFATIAGFLDVSIVSLAGIVTAGCYLGSAALAAYIAITAIHGLFSL